MSETINVTGMTAAQGEAVARIDAAVGSILRDPRFSCLDVAVALEIIKVKMIGTVMAASGPRVVPPTPEERQIIARLGKEGR